LLASPPQKPQKPLLPEWPYPAWPFAVAFGLFALNLVVQTVLYTLFLPSSAGITFSLLRSLVQAMIITLPVIIIVKSYLRQPLSSLGFVREPFLQVLGRGLLSGGLIYFLLAPLSLLYQTVFGPPEELQPIMQTLIGENSAGNKFLLVFMIAVLAPLSEEIFYRGFLFGALRKYLGAFWGIICGGFIFGLIHFQLDYLLLLSVTGMALCWLYEKYRNIWVNILAHAVFNGVNIISLLFSHK